MSIAILSQVYDEMRRLAIAGSVVAGGDFRLKRLIAPLEQAGAKTPVFARVADAVKQVVDAKEQASAEALLELATLVIAILYTQGETGAAGDLQLIESSDLGMPGVQASARVLKPLLEALTTTGSGRLELIRDAHARGAFRDLRLVKPALKALDDPYPEVADLIAEQILPLYGKAIVSESRGKLDIKGRGGHPRRLRLLHALDPDGSRTLVKQALESVSKEVKVVAIECMGAAAEDLSFLIEQASAKAADVRQAAYRALSASDDDDAVAVLQKALKGKDLDIAADAIQKSKSAKLRKHVISEAEGELAALSRTKVRKELGQRLTRLQTIIGCLAAGDDPDTAAFLLKTFGQRSELAKVKGDARSGTDLNRTVVNVMGQGATSLQRKLAEAHASLTQEELGIAFYAARHALPAEVVFDMFARYLSAKPGDKKQWEKREAVCAALGGDYHFWAAPDSGPPLDPRWLDVAVAIKHLGLIRRLGRPGHDGANAFLKETFDALMKKSKSLDDCHEIVSSMVQTGHPDATDAFITAFQKHAKKAEHHAYWYGQMIPNLPKSAVPRLEALIPTLSDRAADCLLDYIQQLRDKP